MNFEHICYGCFQEKPEGAVFCPYCGFDESEEQPFLALPMGTLLNGRYITGKVLGVGGFGITYLGYDLTLEIKVAIKEYMPSGLATRHSDKYSVALTGRGREDYQNGMERFLDEARILAKLQNTPNVVSVQNYFKENNTAYFVMEYIDGMSLKSYLATQGGKIPYDQALTILMPVMQALTQVHELNLTHRDISPDNISITSKGESKLLDFGAARFSIGDEKSVSVILKHGYAPEEQYSSRGNQGPWTDVYAMGATLYRSVTGELPPDSIMRVHSDTLKKPSELGVPLPSHVERALMKALSIKAEDRYPTMQAFIDGLNGNEQTFFRNRTVAGPAGQTVAGPVGQPKRMGGSGKKFGAGKIAVIAVAVLLIAGVAIFAVSRFGGSDGGKGGSPSDTAKSTVPEPKGVSDVALSDYSNDNLNITMGIPEGYAETEEGSGAFTSSDGSATLQVGFYEKNADFPVYSLADVEKNASKYVQYYIGLLESTDITKHEILSQGYREVGSVNAYLIQFAATESGGSVMEFMAAFIESQNEFGCYHVIGAYPQGDEKAEAEVFASITSLQSSGPARTYMHLFRDEEVPFQFMYWDADKEIQTEVYGYDDQMYMSKEENQIAVVVEGHSLSDGITMESCIEAYENEWFDGTKLEQTGESWTTEAGGIQWTAAPYTVTNGENTLYLNLYYGEYDGYAFYVLIGVASEDDIYDGMLLDVTSSIRPVK